jgi:23S rRNA U2552 (ribose-2'-O)-methylase RlmE/FtsJ
MTDGFLHKYFLRNNKKEIYKYVHYFDIYERHFSRFVGKPVTVFEIGVSMGGSLQMWSEYFGKDSVIVGIDINPECKIHEKDNIKVEIGDQSDVNFLRKLLETYGEPNIVIDDGSHVMKDLIETFDFLYSNTEENGVYLVEDLHTAYWEEYGGGYKKNQTFVEFSKNKIDELNSIHTRGAVPITTFTQQTDSIIMYDSVIVFERKPQSKKIAIQTGFMKL